MNILEPLENYKKRFNLHFDGFISQKIGYHLTFELGDDLPNGSLARVSQARNRALDIFQYFIEENSICVFEIYNYEGLNFFDQENKFKNYLFEIVNLEDKIIYNGPFNKVIINSDENSDLKISVIEKALECDIILGKDYVSKQKIDNIIEGIVNLEQGLEPVITQNIYLYDIKENSGFRIYDDRGCHIWSHDIVKMKKVYNKFKDWIV